MTSNFHTEIFSIFLPDQRTLGDIEQVLLTKTLPTGQFDNIDVCRLILVLRSPVGNDISLGTELELANTITSQGTFVKKLHCRDVKYRDEILAHTCQILIIVTPLEWRRRNVGLLLLREFFIQKVAGVKRECTEAFTSLDGEDLDCMRIIPVVIVGHHVILLRRKDHKVHTRCSKPLQLLKVISPPKDNSSIGHKCGKVTSLGTPLDIVFTPCNTCLLLSGTIIVQHWLLPSIVPENSSFLPMTDGKLITLTRILQPTHSIGLFLKRFWFRLLEFFLFHISQVRRTLMGQHMKSVVLIKLVLFQYLNSLLGITGCFIFDKGTSYSGTGLFVKWHEESAKVRTLIVGKGTNTADEFEYHLS
mmetsp:Transcript_7747/g.13059  ORF Transcript_7747/g.13059 Transcript_7747/m.13059 type:complete len:360 (+) Transcript_7747:968-2047(+)